MDLEGVALFESKGGLVWSMKKKAFTKIFMRRKANASKIKQRDEKRSVRRNMGKENASASQWITIKILGASH